MLTSARPHITLQEAAAEAAAADGKKRKPPVVWFGFGSGASGSSNAWSGTNVGNRLARAFSMNGRRPQEPPAEPEDLNAHGLGDSPVGQPERLHAAYEKPRCIPGQRQMLMRGSSFGRSPASTGTTPAPDALLGKPPSHLSTSAARPGQQLQPAMQDGLDSDWGHSAFAAAASTSAQAAAALLDVTDGARSGSQGAPALSPRISLLSAELSQASSAAGSVGNSPAVRNTPTLASASAEIASSPDARVAAGAAVSASLGAGSAAPAAAAARDWPASSIATTTTRPWQAAPTPAPNLPTTSPAAAALPGAPHPATLDVPHPAGASPSTSRPSVMASSGWGAVSPGRFHRTDSHGALLKPLELLTQMYQGSGRPIGG